MFYYYFTSQEVGTALGEKMDTMETILKSKMNKKIEKFEGKIDNLFSTPEWKEKNKYSAGGSWRLPFMFLLFLMLGGCGGVYYFYQKLLRKMHLP